MKPFLPARWAGVFAVVLVLSCTVAHANPLDPLQPNASELEYRSVFERYQLSKSSEITPWQQSNQVVVERGGWRAYAQEALTADSPKEEPVNHRHDSSHLPRSAP